MKSFFIVVVLMLRNGGAQTRIGGAPRAKESVSIGKPCRSLQKRHAAVSGISVPSEWNLQSARNTCSALIIV